MQTSTLDASAWGGYQLHLPTFEGPLDLLLRLIERQQLAITEVSLMGVTEQFLAYLESMDEMPTATMGEFAAVAGRLILLKSRSLLPRPPVVDAEEEDPGDLVRQLVEYRAMRAVADHLGMRDRTASGAFSRGDGVILPERPPARLALHQPGTLARALRRRLTAVTAPPEAIASRPVVSLRAMTERLLNRLSGERPLTFGRVRATCVSRQEELVAFLAVLVLMRRRLIVAEQEQVFGEITLRRTSTAAPLPVSDL